MRASDVSVLQAPDPGDAYTDPDFLLVETLPDKRGRTRTTIDRISACGQRGRGWAVKAVGPSLPVGHSAAREWAVSYAAANGIPVVYERDLLA